MWPGVEIIPYKLLTFIQVILQCTNNNNKNTEALKECETLHI